MSCYLLYLAAWSSWCWNEPPLLACLLHSLLLLLPSYSCWFQWLIWCVVLADIGVFLLVPDEWLSANDVCAAGWLCARETAGTFAVIFMYYWTVAMQVTTHQLHVVIVLLVCVFPCLVQENNIPFSSSLSKQRQVAHILYLSSYFSIAKWIISIGCYYVGICTITCGLNLYG
jgi:hypothetical protein